MKGVLSNPANVLNAVALTVGWTAPQYTVLSDFVKENSQW